MLNIILFCAVLFGSLAADQNFMIPERHPAKSTLDHIFKKTLVTKNENTLTQAGFNVVSHNTSSFVWVVSHPKLPGYLVKLYLETEKRMRLATSSQALTMRCEGARNIRKLIKEQGLVHFSAPKKWLYRVPHTSKHPLILLVEDMNLAPAPVSAAAWFNASPEILKELFCILSHGYASTFLTGNIPYTNAGKFACIDTEFPVRTNNLKKVNKYLSPESSDYWNELTGQ